MAMTTDISRFQLTGGHLCLDFTNTMDNRLSKEKQVDNLRTYRDLGGFAEQSGLITSSQAHQLFRQAERGRGAAEKALQQAKKLREALFEIFSAAASGKRPSSSALAELNVVLKEAGAQRELAAREGHFQWLWAGAWENLQSILWPIAYEAAQLLASENLSYVRMCAADDCGWLFLDKSKSHSRRWCDMKSCGNRDKARRFYERQKAEQ
jgi:predicted RNA-binding Zn ribbon-like protein